MGDTKYHYYQSDVGMSSGWFAVAFLVIGVVFMVGIATKELPPLFLTEEEFEMAMAAPVCGLGQVSSAHIDAYYPVDDPTNEGSSFSLTLIPLGRYLGIGYSGRMGFRVGPLIFSP